MRMLHVADLHVGKLMNGFSLIEDQAYILDEICAAVTRLHADALLIPGDLYDRSTPSSESVGLMDHFLSQAVQTGVPVFVTSGNHDSPERIGYGASLLAEQGLFLSPAYDGTIQHYTINDEWGPVVFWLIPFLKPAVVRHFHPEAQIDTYTDMMRFVVETCDIDTSVRNVALSHQFVTGDNYNPMADFLKKNPHSDIQVGGLNNVDVSAYEPFDYVALGHVHKSGWVGRESVRYCGSPLRFTLADDELRNEKTLTIIDMGKKTNTTHAEITISTEPFVPLHEVRAIRGPLAVLTSNEIADSAPRDDYLRVTITDENPPIDALARVHAVYPNVLEFLVDNTRTNAPNTAMNPVQSQEDRPVTEVFADFYQKQNGVSLTQDQSKAVDAALEKAEAQS